MRPTLIADGGEMTVGRRTSTYVYGVFQVDIPEGREQAQQDDRLQEGYIYRPDQRPTGRVVIGVCPCAPPPAPHPPPTPS